MAKFSVLALVAYLGIRYIGLGKTGFGVALYVGASIRGLALLAIWAGTGPAKSLRGMFLITSAFCVISAIQLPPQFVIALLALSATFGTLTLWAWRMNCARRPLGSKP